MKTEFAEFSLKRCTSLAVGGRATCVSTPETSEELRQTLCEFRARGLDPFILGGGCNTLFPDRPFERPVVLTERLDRISLSPSGIRAEAGVRLEVLVRTAMRHGLGGLEIFTGIPGTVGGAVVMNAGGAGCEFGQRVKSIVAIDPTTGEFARLRGNDLNWGYRSTELNGLVVSEVELELRPDDPKILYARAKEFMKRKAMSQPLKSPSAGCVFKNPPGMPAALLIDRAGLKGDCVGGAMVSQRHANFIVNEGGRASASDVLALIERVRSKVRRLFRVQLDLEIVLARD